MTIQELIIQLISEGNSPSMIANRANVSRGTVHNWLKGKVKAIRVHNAKALADNLGYQIKLEETGNIIFAPIPQELQLSNYFGALSDLLNDTQAKGSIHWGEFSKAKITAMNNILYKISGYSENEILALEAMLKEKSDS